MRRVTKPPNTHAKPDPDDGATVVALTQTLRWQPGDPDGDPVTYTVAFESSDPPPIVASDVVTTTFDPGLLSYAVTYTWRIKATDGISVTTGPLWRFTTAEATWNWVYLPLVPGKD